jgi:hypothetical protein
MWKTKHAHFVVVPVSVIAPYYKVVSPPLQQIFPIPHFSNFFI